MNLRIHPSAPSRSWRRRRAAAPAGTVLALLAGLVLAWAASAGPALAADGPPSCSAGTCAVSFITPGTGQSFTVPPGVTSLSVTLYGGVGGGAIGGITGGDGAQVTASLTVSPGSTLGVDAGGAAGSLGQGGVNGGGSSETGGAGGGATDVTSAGTPLLVAGGGGGAGLTFEGSLCTGGTFTAAGGAGGNADNPGDVGTTVVDGGLTLHGGGGGSPGTTSGAGGGGPGGQVDQFSSCLGQSPGLNGIPGSGMTGGLGAAGGGGGGGYFGGGAGGDAAVERTSGGFIFAGAGGAGGGASYTGGAAPSPTPVVTDTGNSGQVNGGNGEARFSYPDPISTGAPSYATTQGQALTVTQQTGLLSSAAGTTGPASDPLAATGPPGGTTAQGGTVIVNPDGSFSYTPPSASFTGTDTFGYTVADSSGDYATGTATIQVQPADASLTITHIAAFANRHRQAAAGVTFTDADPGGNLSQYTGSIAWGDGTTTTIPKSQFVAIPPRFGGGFAAGDVHTYAKPGTYTVTITITDTGGASASARTPLNVPRH